MSASDASLLPLRLAFVLLDAQRTLYAAEQGLIAKRLAEQANRVTLYKVLGGGWK